MREESVMQAVCLVLGVVCVCCGAAKEQGGSSRGDREPERHSFVTGFVVSRGGGNGGNGGNSGKDLRQEDEAASSGQYRRMGHERLDQLIGRDGREIVEIIPEASLVNSGYPIDCIDQKECDSSDPRGDATPTPTFRPYSQEELNSFLKKYVEENGGKGQEPTNKLANLYMDEPVNVLEDKAKAWMLMNANTNTNSNTNSNSNSNTNSNSDSPKESAYDDRSSSWNGNGAGKDPTGWVSLEPVPWSASQIQRWEPNKRPSQIPQHWDQNQQQNQQSQQNQHETSSRPWSRPPASNSYDYRPGYKPSQNSGYRPSPNSGYRPETSGGGPDSWGAGSDIITDDRPSSFPYDSTQGSSSRPSWYRPQETNERFPGDADGRWVLLSSTKGYSLPTRSRTHQRSLILGDAGSQGTMSGSPPSIKSHRSVRLLVLPAEDGVNTTFSHGGLLEVESGSLTVDQSQREHAAKMLKLQAAALSSTPSPSLSSPSPINKPSIIKASPIKRAGRVKVYPIKTDQSRNNAMLAAVGAGMIPATMAMLLPMVLGRKRRSIDPPQIFQIPYQTPQTPIYS